MSSIVTAEPVPAHLPETERSAALREALAAACSISIDALYAQALTTLAPHLPEMLFPDALAAARTISNDEYRIPALITLGLHLPETERSAVLREALTAARAISNNAVRAEVLTTLAPHLSGTERSAALTEALAASRAMSNNGLRTEVLTALRARLLTALAVHLPETERSAVLREALTAARAISNDRRRAEILTALAPHLPETMSALKPQFFIVRVIGNENQPDVEILTLPDHPRTASMSDFEQLEREVFEGEHFHTVAGSRIECGPDTCLKALHQAIVNGGIRQHLFWTPEHYTVYAQEIFSTQPVILMNSPVSGSPLGSLVAAAGGGAAFMAAFPNADIGHVMIYFLLIGGTRIVLGAADGISIALRQGLSHVLLRWMGVVEKATPVRKQTRAGPEQNSQKS